MGLGYYKSGASIRRELIQIWVHHCAPGWLAEFFKTFNGALPVLKINLQPENYFSRGVFVYAEPTHFNPTLLSENVGASQNGENLDTHPPAAL